jgi:hypothetical protein
MPSHLPVKIPPSEDTVTTANKQDHPNPATASPCLCVSVRDCFSVLAIREDSCQFVDKAVFRGLFLIRVICEIRVKDSGFQFVVLGFKSEADVRMQWAIQILRQHSMCLPALHGKG